MRIERRYPLWLMLAVLPLLLAFVLAFGVAAWGLYADGSFVWGTVVAAITAFLTFCVGAFAHRHFVRRVPGYYLELGEEALVVGEIDGAVLQQHPLEEIRGLRYDDHNGDRTVVELRDGSWKTLREIDIQPEEFDQLVSALAHVEPPISIERW